MYVYPERCVQPRGRLFTDDEKQSVHAQARPVSEHENSVDEICLICLIVQT